MLNTHSNSMSKRTNKEAAACSRRSLNDFDDAILKHILSFLPTKLAAQTSVLSKRWEYMWTSLPNLHFKDDSFIQNELGHTNTNDPKRQRFMNFVDRALILHISCIPKFSLRCQVNHDFSPIKTWIAAVSRNVQEFEIKLCHSYGDQGGKVEDVFPFHLFNCASLQVLKLHDHCIHLRLPSHVSLPCLKILTLQGITVKDCHPINLLFAGPALEQLVINYCAWIGEYDVIISAPKLWKLSINDLYESFKLGAISITISAPQLQTLVYKGPLCEEYRFPCPPSITNATLDFPRCMEDSSEINKVHFDKVLRSLQSVECLALSPAFAWALSNSTVPKFSNLINLEVFGGDIELTCTELARLVNKCPSLKSLRFLQRFSLKATYKFNDLLNLKFQYLPSTLKEFMIGCCSGEIEDISFLRILLSKLTSLETMKINFRWNVARREEIKSILSALHRGSKSCKLIMS